MDTGEACTIKRGLERISEVPSSAEQQANSSRAKSRLQQINFSDQLSGCLIGELACPSHAIEFGPFGAKTGQPQLSFDLVNFAGQHCLFAGFGRSVDDKAP